MQTVENEAWHVFLAHVAYVETVWFCPHSNTAAVLPTIIPFCDIEGDFLSVCSIHYDKFS